MTPRPEPVAVPRAVCWPATPLGPLWAEVCDNRLTSLHWGAPRTAVDVSTRQPLLRLMLDGYFKKSLYLSDYNLFKLEGTPFQQRVWQALCDIPFGSTLTYGQLAARLKSSPRAVGQAVGANPLPLLVPCHRVVGAGGSLTGFSAPGGVETKAWLLRHEGVIS